MSGPPHRRRSRPFKPGQQALQLKARTVSDEQLRQLFVDARILERVQNGELVEHVIKENTPAPESNQSEGTKSQYIAYRDKAGKTIAEAHRFLRKDGSLGASHKADPKMVLHEGTIYRNYI
jgi:hypothetical protein